MNFRSVVIFKSKRTLIIAAICILLLIIILKHAFQKPYRYAGTLEATLVDISSRLAAAIDEVRVQEGDAIQKDQVLITFNCEDFKIAARQAHETYFRDIRLLKNNFISQDLVDQAKHQMDTADTRVNWCTLTSPLDGKVLTREHEPGEWTQPGTKILTVADVHNIWAFIYVPQPKVANLALGMNLTGYVAELNDQPFCGTIIKISDTAEFTPKNVQTEEERQRLIYGVKVSFEKSNVNDILKPGMTVEVELPK